MLEQGKVLLALSLLFLTAAASVSFLRLRQFLAIYGQIMQSLPGLGSKGHERAAAPSFLILIAKGKLF